MAGSLSLKNFILKSIMDTRTSSFLRTVFILRDMNFYKDSEQNIGRLEKENQGQFGQLDNSATLLKSVDDFSVLGKKPRHAYIQKKAEKLVEAVYLITGFVSDNEPLKWDMRKASLSILTDITTLGVANISDIDVRIKNIASETEKIGALLGVAKIAGFVSEMNVMILHEEYQMLASLAAAERQNPSQKNFVFSREFFTGTETPHSEAPSIGNPELSKGQIKDKTNNVLYSTQRMVSDKSQGISAPSVIESISTPKKIEKNSRRDLIAELVKEKKEASIKDIVSHFSDCGEKTIQRELVVLVQTGILKKIGDRRWSRYLIA